MKNYITIFVLLVSSSLLKAQPGASLKVYYGLLHAHTMICDGSGTPEDAYRLAKANGLNFFAVTAHNHAAAENMAKERKDGVLISTKPELYNGNSNVTVNRNWQVNNTAHSETVSVKPLIRAAREATTSNFLALYGQEFSTISSGNHMNLFGSDQVLTVGDGNFKALLTEVKRIQSSGGMKPILQLNHPDVSQDLFYKGTDRKERNKMYNDYGIDEADFGPHFRDLTKAIGPFTHLIEVLTGPALSEVYKPYHALENDYFFYLKQGLHLSPSAGQDNHYKNWGSITDARTGVLSNSLSEAAIYDALRKNRTFVTEDKNLSVVLSLNNSLMGSSITALPESELNFTVAVSDADEPSATYQLEIYGAGIAPELSTAATNWMARDGLLIKKKVTGNGSHTLKGIFALAEPSFYYLKVIQNPLNKPDRAWTAPVWVNETGTASLTDTLSSVPDRGELPDAKFYWTASRSSAVYHVKECKSVNMIKASNLRYGDNPPPGRVLHVCVIEEDEDEIEH
jgi:hypothetical protein